MTHYPIIDEIEGISHDKVLLGNLQWVTPKMLKEKLIEKNGEVLKLTLKGKNRCKRTTRLVREKWRRELSSITCSWIAKRNGYDTA